ncbi:hypothetical protein GE061_010318 [Apolygus lucorum]|uniref:Nuclear receptor coactivator 2 n=1 Tax=Apolygus lucorum TaxID=248454 RepID=A0A8S9Y2N7_APOLU|nr:hypothetical protein GE061_010318 [Apolygus lucorum]
MCEWSVPDWGGATAPSPPPDHLYSPPNSLVRCELPSDPLWAKMSSTGASSKKRKKPDTKPQSQLAKSLNEKRRRELENVFIEELAELISAASFADMSSLAVKPDKCAILQETVNQIKHIKEQEAAATRTIDAVQQGEVSSSKPTILTNDFFGPLLLEALEGFLFVVNQDGKVEYVTDNIATFIKFTKDEVLGKPVYNILHHGDHGRFNSALLPPVWSSLEGSSSSVVASGGGSSSNSTNPPRNRTFNCRFLIKPPDDSNQTVEEKQQRVSKYENMQVVLINSTQIAQLTSGGDKDEEGNDIGPCLMCVARRIMPNEKHHAGSSLEQFSMKMDPQGKIIGIDTTGLSPGLAQFINKKDLIGKNLDNVVHAGDFSKVSSHVKDVQTHSQGTSSIYRIRVTPANSGDKYIHVQTKSKLFKSMSEPDFIMSTHSIVTAGGEEQSFNMVEANSPASVSGQSTSSSMGNQMMLSGSVNGAPIRSETTPSSVSSSELANTINSLSNTSNFQTVSLNQGLVSNDLSHDITFADLFPSTTWPDMGERIGTGLAERGGWERSESRASLTSASSPLAPAPATPSYSNSNMPFSPSYMDDKESNEAQGSSNPCRLRNLLTEGIGAIKRESTDSESGAGGGGNSSQEHPGEKNKYSLLTKILNEKEEDQQGSGHHPDQSPHNKPKNNMLLQLLNKNDDEDMEQKGGASDDLLLNNLGLGSLTTSQAETIRRGTKRPSSEDNQGMGSGGNTPQGGDDGPNPAKRPANSLLDTVPSSAPVSSSSVNSKLWEKNRMLASLLANPPSTPTTIPPVPASVISATPQDKLPRVIKNNPQNTWSGCNVQQGGAIPHSPQGAGGQGVGRHGTGSAHQSVSSPDYVRYGEDSSDPYLSLLLDQVIEIAPEDSPALANIINSIEANSQGILGGSPFQQDHLTVEKINERMAINAIQKSLMQCETLQQKTPVYTVSQVTSVQGQQQFPPPPLYQQNRQRLAISTGLRQGQYNLGPQQQQLLMQQQQVQRTKLLQQQQTKQRLLQLQQQQQLLIPSNSAATSGDQSGIHNIDSLMNNTVAPNVSLQRSASVPDSQLSPVGSYSGSGSSTPNMIGSGSSQISPGQRQPFSPQPFSPVNGGMNTFQGSGGSGGSTTPNQSGQGVNSQGAQQARMSPSSLQNFQQAQLSPRLSQGQSAGYVQTQSTSWSQQQANRISIQQQQNPMLNAQLTGGNYNSSGARNFNPGTPPGAGGGTPPTSVAGNGGRVGLPPVRSLTSPGSRHSPFPPELSPTAAGSATNYQSFRIQRSLSGPTHQSVVPQATTHLPGGNNGMTEYVKHEIRAMVGARTGSGGAGLRGAGGGSQQAQQVGLSPHHIDTLGFAIELQPQGVGESQKMWNNMSEMGASSPQSASLQSRSSLEDVNRSNDQKSSLLQKLLSE